MSAIIFNLRKASVVPRKGPKILVALEELSKGQLQRVLEKAITGSVTKAPSEGS